LAFFLPYIEPHRYSSYSKDLFLTLLEAETLRIFDQIKDLIREIRKGVADPEFWEIVEETTGQKPKKA